MGRGRRDSMYIINFVISVININLLILVYQHFIYIKSLLISFFVVYLSNENIVKITNDDKIEK